MNYEIIEVTLNRLTQDFLYDFELYQEVDKCWRYEDNLWQLKNIEYTEDWDAFDKQHIIKDLKDILQNRGCVLAAISDNKVIGFSSVDLHLFNQDQNYMNLSMIYVSKDYRHQGVGRKLFECMKDIAKEYGARKLYISAHSAEDTIAFYKKIGCTLAKELNSELVIKEPFDMQLEYDLFKGEV